MIKFIFLLFPYLLYANEPTILEDLVDEIGIDTMSSKLELQKNQSDKNTQRIDELSNRLKLMDKQMQEVLNSLSSQKKDNKPVKQNKKVVKIEKKKLIIDEGIIYTLQFYSSYDKESAIRFFTQLPEFVRNETKLYKIGRYFVLRYGAKKVRADLSPIKKQLIQIGYEDIFSVKTSMKRFNAAKDI